MNLPFALTKTVKGLLISFLAAFIVQQSIDRFFGGNLLGWLALVPGEVVFHWKIWQLVTYLFLHADVSHLILNSLMVVFIGSELETIWGQKKFLNYFFFCGIFSGVLYLLLQAVFFTDQGLRTPMVGASGAIYGLLIAYGILFGERVLLFMMLFPMKARYFVWVLAGVEFLTTLFGPRGNALSSVAHLGGMLGGLVYLRAWALLKAQNRTGAGFLFSRAAPKDASHSKRGSHLRLVKSNDKDADEDETPRTWH